MKSPEQAGEGRVAAITSLRQELAAGVAPLLNRGGVALLDYQDGNNCGDCALWVGAHRLVRRLGRPVTYAATMASFDAERCRRATDGGTVLFGGGGNFGDIWPAHQTHRERVMAELRDRRVVQLPQSMHFGRPAALERARRAVAAHPDFHLLLRDQPSYERAVQLFDCEVRLCPDLAFELGPLDRGEPAPSALALARGDRESWVDLAGAARARGIPVADWPGDRAERDPRYLAAFAAARALRWSDAKPRLSGRFPRGRAPLYHAAASRRLLRGIRLLASARAVVTDRLHAHLLCELLGIPHIALDTQAGKVSALHDTWMRPWAIGSLMRSPGEACDAVLARSGPPGWI